MSVLLTRHGPLLKLNAVHRRVEGVTVLDQFSATIDVGERVGLVGPGGAGKTALFDAITGLARADAGSIWYDGRALLGERPDRIVRLGIGRTFEEPRPLLAGGGATVRASVELAAAAALGIHVLPPLRRGLAGRRRERVARLADAALERAGLAAWADQPADALAPAQRVYLDLARALAPGPQLLLLDRPAAGLTAAADREAFAALVRRLGDEGLTVVLAEHDLALVTELCPRVLVIHRGRRIADGPPERVGANPEVLRAFAGTRAGAARAA